MSVFMLNIYQELRRWVGIDWDAERFDVGAANRALRSRSR